MKTILFVGGGSGGHITPYLNLSKKCVESDYNTHTLCLDASLDREIIATNFTHIPINNRHFISTGKLRTYLSLQLIPDIYRFIKALYTSYKLLQRIKPDIIFLKGGMVCYPIVLTNAYLCRHKAKVLLHESDSVSGAMTHFLMKHASKVYKSFDNTVSYPLFSIPNITNKPYIQRKSMLPMMFITGGSQGSVFINTLIYSCIDELCKHYEVHLQAGIGKINSAISHPNLVQYEMIDIDLMHILTRQSDIIVQRGGSGSIFTTAYYGIKSITIPLPESARNHQVHNALFFHNKHLTYYLDQNDAHKDTFLRTVKHVMDDDIMHLELSKHTINDATDSIFSDIKEMI